MSMAIPRSAVALVLLGAVGAVWWTGRDADAAPERGTAASAGAAEATRAMRSELELAVTSTANAAECGHTEVGYDHRTPEEAARHVVALMKSATATPGEAPPPPGTAVDYVEGRPGAPWQVAVRPDPEGEHLLIEGYGPDLAAPMFSRRVSCR